MKPFVQGRLSLARLLALQEELLRRSQPVVDSQEDRDHRAGSDQQRDQKSRTEDQKPEARNRGPRTRDQGPLLGAQAKAEYRRRLDDLRDELAEAEHNSDLGRAAKARQEMQLIAEQLAGAVGLGGRDRPAGANAERARLAVTKGIKAALDRIRANHPELARHFAASIKTGHFCSYTPDVGRLISWVA